jgi:nucleotide-binding universal stress UspA family protein
MSRTDKILVTLELPDPDPIQPVIAETVASMEVVVLGHYGLPEQTPASAARNQFGADARATLEEAARPLENAGISVTTRLVFGKARDKAINSVAIEEECGVILTSGQVGAIERLFVPLRGEANFDRILSFVGELLTATDASVTLFHATEESDRMPGEALLADATEHLVEGGVDPDRIERELAESEDIGRSIVSIGAEYDLMVLGETEPSLRNRILGTVPAQVTADTDDPAFVVRNPAPEE